MNRADRYVDISEKFKTQFDLVMRVMDLEDQVAQLAADACRHKGEPLEYTRRDVVNMLHERATQLRKMLGVSRVHMLRPDGTKVVLKIEHVWHTENGVLVEVV